MRTNHCWRLLALGCWASLLVLSASAQIYSVLYSFTNSPDGGQPAAGLTLSGSVLYGTTYYGGTSSNGTIFKVNTDGTGYMVLKNFSATPDPLDTNTDGAHPNAGLTLSSNVLYGTTTLGGGANAGTVFKVNTDGTGYTVLKSFGYNPDAETPYAGLTLSGNVLYGTTFFGGSTTTANQPRGFGTIFKVNTDGTGYKVLYGFSASSDGADPAAGLTLSGNVLYGTAQFAGSSSSGTIFKVNTDGTGFTNLHSFSVETYSSSINAYPYTNSDGAIPQADLALSGNVLYGTTYEAGSAGNGTIFKVNTDGTGFMVLKTFSATTNPNYTNTDGANPRSGLTMFNNVLYGTTSGGGEYTEGTVFKINADGTGYSVLRSFNNSPDGASPAGDLILDNNVVYGTAGSGGSSSWGTVFSLTGVLPGYNHIAGQLLGDGTMQLSFVGIAGGNYALDSTASLSPANWLPQATNTADALGNLIFTNAPDPTTNAFWRIRSVP